MTDADGGVATDTATVTVVSRTSSLTLTTRTALRSRATVTAHIGDSVDALSARLLGHVVTFTRGGATCTAATDAAGSASCALPASALSLGPSTVTAQFVGDTLYSSSTGAGRVIVYALPPGGLFVIGDRSTTRAVTFWSPLWSLRNMLSGGPAPMSFKGFATATETGGWVASPGFSGAPESIPEWMAVLVASKVDKVGSSIHVTVSRMVVVHVGAYNDHLIGIGIVAGSID